MTRLAQGRCSSPNSARPRCRSAGRSAPAPWAPAPYLDELAVTLTGDAYIFRNRCGAPHSKDTLQLPRCARAEFAPGSTVLGHDFRRSGAVQAITREANPLSHTMGNTLSASNGLFATYVPVSVVTINQAAKARRKGRRHCDGRTQPAQKLERAGPESWNGHRDDS